MSEHREAVDASTIIALLSIAAEGQRELPQELVDALARDSVSTQEREAIIDSVRRLQGVNAHLRRRTQELAALFSTARELVQLQDLDVVLERLVERAHDIIGTDVTYLSEVDPATGGIYVRHSVGTVTAEFKNLEVPAGMGLASKVVAARAPVWTANYETMDEAPHDPGIDRAVQEEGLVSFLGVPMMVGDEILGALFACNRVAHEFAPEQIVLLSAFADHAAAVVNSAHLLEQTRRAADEARKSNEVLEQHVLAIERAGVVHEELTAIVMSGGSVVDVSATLARALERSVTILDAHLRVLCSHPRSESGRSLGTLPAAHDAVTRSRTTGHVETFASAGRKGAAVAILGTDSLLGAVVVECDDGIPDAVERRTLERAAQIAALLTLKQDAVTAAELERKSKLLSSALHDAPDHAAAWAAEAQGGTVPALADLVSVVGVHPPRGLLESGLRVAHRIVGVGGLATTHNRMVVVVTTTDDAEECATLLREAMIHDLGRPTTAVAGPALADPERELRSAVVQIGQCFELLPSLGVGDQVVSSDAYAPYFVLLGPKRHQASEFIDRILGAVIAWDDKRGTDLVGTLTEYFKQGESRAGAARNLQVHKNTVQQRLDRVAELVGGDWTDAEFRFRLHIALRLHLLRTRADH